MEQDFCIKQKFNRFRIKHHEFNDMLNQKDFGWNTERNPVTAEEETCKNYVKAKIIYQIGFTDYQRRDMHVKPTRISFFILGTSKSNTIL